ncbi:tyrosine-protein kinase Btk29A [Hyalella azteca]|uniref:non-specific protein-tyrosine kinase n=1 Tax=Hyalella azteca TaxID=294128 RepID=A0A8B7N6Q4_HYAAZ|nr:tyrosine-protein kinase Btk29A [Hyalella azteca]
MDREATEALLRPAEVPPMTHLVRKSVKETDFVISYKKLEGNSFGHRKIFKHGDSYWTKPDMRFSSMAELVQHSSSANKWILFDKFYETHTQQVSPNSSVGSNTADTEADYEASAYSDYGQTMSNSSETASSVEVASSEEAPVVSSLIVELNRKRQITSQDPKTTDVRKNSSGALGRSSSIVSTRIVQFNELQNSGEIITDTRSINAPKQEETIGVTLPESNDNIAATSGNTATTGQSTPSDPKQQEEEEQVDKSDWYLNPGDVTKEQRLGAGNYGEVWKVVLRRSGKVFAMKTMKPAKMALEEFEKEVTTMMSFRHPNLVKTYGVCSDPYESFILIDYLVNGSLMDYMKDAREGKKNPLSEGQKYQIACGVLKGMKYLSEENCIHRDLAARNVLLTDDLTPRVADFGLALLVDPKQPDKKKKDTMGTPWMWTAPEALRGKDKWSSKSDVWSYGVFCWELYTDCTSNPYAPEIVSSLHLSRYLLKGGRLTLPSSCHLTALILSCWTYDPSERPSFKDLHEQMQQQGAPKATIQNNITDVQI